ncbi:MAG: hypothetical protein V1706_16770 [Pseudomonadota bacterium]
MSTLLFKFGALSVLVLFQAVVLKVAVAVFLVLAGLLVWRWYR